MRVQVRGLVAAVALVGCGAASQEPVAPPEPAAPPPPVERFDVVRCGVDDAPGATVPSGSDALEISASAALPQPFADALSTLPIAHCGAIAHSSDEGSWTMHIALRGDGSVAEGSPTGTRHLTPFARCFLELWCAVPPLVNAGAGADIKVQVARPGRARRIEVATDPEGGTVTDFDQRLVREAARQAAGTCAPGFAVPTGAMVSSIVTLTTLRSLENFRRKTRASAETFQTRDLDPAVAACVRDKLAELAWGDRHHEQGARKVRVVVRWGEDLDRASVRQRGPLRSRACRSASPSPSASAWAPTMPTTPASSSTARGCSRCSATSRPSC